MKKSVKRKIQEISDWDRVKSMLILLGIRNKLHPDEHNFYWPEEKMLSVHSDQFDMERAFEIIKKETDGNVEAKYETVSLFSDVTGLNLNATQKRILMRIKDKEKFLKDYKRIDTTEEASKSNKIEKIEIIEIDGEEKLQVYVNEDYKNKICPNKKGIGWGNLLKLAKEDGENIRVGTSKEAIYICDYFNTNKNNILYTKGHYALSEILAKDEDYISSLIPIKTITPKGITQRKNILLKNT